MNTSNSFQNRKVLEPLANYLLTHFYSSIDEEEGDVYEQMFHQIVDRAL